MENPLQQIREDWQAARARKDPMAELCALSTVGVDDGRPRVRTLVLWGIEEGPVLLTNTTSPKWHELQRNPHFEAMLLWTSIQKQYRLRGVVAELSDRELRATWQGKRYELKLLDHYYSRGRQQSTPIDHAEFLREMAELEREFPEPGAAPMPDTAKGLMLRAQEIDVWSGEGRFPERLLFVRGADGGWSKTNLSP